MSKTADSDAGCVMMLDSPADVMRKFKRAVTDSESEVRYDPDQQAGREQPARHPRRRHRPVGRRGGRGYTQYGALKTDTGEAIVALLEPIQARYDELIDDKTELTRLLRVGSDRARNVASKTLKRAYDAIGLIPA